MSYGERSRTEHKLVWVGMIGIIGLLVMFVAYSFWPSENTTTVAVGPKTFHAQIAATEEAREVGMTEWVTIREDQALLMVYESDGVWPIRTRDMQFPVDIVWIGRDKRVAFVAQNAKPSATTTYRPGGKSRYVLQLAGGTALRYNISTGKQVNFTYGEEE